MLIHELDHMTSLLTGFMVILSGSTYLVNEPAEKSVVRLSLNPGACFNSACEQSLTANSKGTEAY